MASFGVAASTSTRLVSSATSACRARRPRNLSSPQMNRNRVLPTASLQDIGSPILTVHRSVSTNSSSSLSDRGARGPLSSRSSLSANGWLEPPLGPGGTPMSTLAANAASKEDTGNDGSAVNALAAFLACALSYVAATAATASNVHADPLLSKTSAKFNPRTGGGGGGPQHKMPKLLVSREEAEKDVKDLEDHSMENPYMVSVHRRLLHHACISSLSKRMRISLQVSQQAFQGARWTMEDTYLIENGGRFVAVFDGHGGDAVSTTLRDRLFGIYTKELAKKHRKEQNEYGAKRSNAPSPSSHVGALQNALEQVEDIVIQEDSMEYQGSTAVCVVTHIADDGKRTLLSANVGDSRAILSRTGNAVDLTRDHKPNDELERERITSMGEEIEWDTYGQVYRVRDLSLSRAIGDRFAKPVVTSEPEILSYSVTDDDDEFILLASDGLWDVMTSQEVVDFVHENLEDHPELSSIKEKRRYMATVVANEALERGSADNVCVVLVWLNEDSV